LKETIDVNPKSARNKAAEPQPGGGDIPGAASRPELSLNMIVKDEVENLREGLAAIAGLFDEVVVVDTGSGDGTAALAESVGAKVIQHPWSDSFADARNAALGASKGRWIFWLDADDRIDPNAVETLRKFIDRAIPCGVLFPLDSSLGRDGASVRNYTLRLFPNHPGIEWTGAVHEQIAPSLHSAGIELVNCPDFSIRHTGYEDEEATFRKNIRNLKLLAGELAARPEDPYVLLALAQAFLYCGQGGHAENWLELLWKLNEKSEANGSRSGSHGDVFWMAAIMLADLALKRGDADGADAWFGQAIGLLPGNWLAYFRLGEKKLAEGDISRAAELLEKTAAIGIGPTLLPLDLNAFSGRLDAYLLKIRRMSKATA
jgi:glycosyltransferase involved in cell wall biosynthesis